ncbi:MAG: hypothetical protein ACJAUP_003336 [Cellvibrionaceae bacterium]
MARVLYILLPSDSNISFIAFLGALNVLNHGQRSKIETYDQQLFVVVNMPVIS